MDEWTDTNCLCNRFPISANPVSLHPLANMRSRAKRTRKAKYASFVIAAFSKSAFWLSCISHFGLFVHSLWSWSSSSLQSNECIQNEMAQHKHAKKLFSTEEKQLLFRQWNQVESREWLLLKNAVAVATTAAHDTMSTFPFHPRPNSMLFVVISSHFLPKLFKLFSFPLWQREVCVCCVCAPASTIQLLFPPRFYIWMARVFVTSVQLTPTVRIRINIGPYFIPDTPFARCPFLALCSRFAHSVLLIFFFYFPSLGWPLLCARDVHLPPPVRPSGCQSFQLHNGDDKNTFAIQVLWTAPGIIKFKLASTQEKSTSTARWVQWTKTKK